VSGHSRKGALRDGRTGNRVNEELEDLPLTFNPNFQNRATTSHRYDDIFKTRNKWSNLAEALPNVRTK
jgi:hypothetical protein